MKTDTLTVMLKGKNEGRYVSVTWPVAAIEIAGDMTQALQGMGILQPYERLVVVNEIEIANARIATAKDKE